MTKEDYRINELIKAGEELEQFLFIVYYTNPLRGTVRIIADDGAIKMTLPNDKFIYLMNELLQPRTFEMEESFQRIKLSINSYGKWYFFDRTKNIFKELGELPQEEFLDFTQKPAVKDKFKAVIQEHNKIVINPFFSEKEKKN